MNAIKNLFDVGERDGYMPDIPVEKDTKLPPKVFPKCNFRYVRDWSSDYDISYEIIERINILGLTVLRVRLHMGGTEVRCCIYYYPHLNEFFVKKDWDPQSYSLHHDSVFDRYYDLCITPEDELETYVLGPTASPPQQSYPTLQLLCYMTIWIHQLDSSSLPPLLQYFSHGTREIVKPPQTWKHPQFSLRKEWTCEYGNRYSLET